MDRSLAKSLNTIQGSLFAFVSAIFAELLFGSFLVRNNSTAPFGRILIVFLSLYAIHRFTLHSLQAEKKTTHDLLCLGSILLTFMGILWLGKNLALSLSGYSPGLTTQSIYFAMPFAAGGLLLQVVLGIRYALVFGISLAVIVAMYSTDAPLAFLLVLVSTLVACLSLSRVRSRSAFIRSGILVTVVSLSFALSSILIDSNLSNVDVLIRIFGAPFGGIVVVMIATAFMPVVEHLGGYVTDIRLIEMATLDHPLLKELSIQAPGTWNHSMVMGMMSEVAADAIGANPIIARVGCYFHDIGKVKKPLYFVENQLDGKNPHDKLSASMSALIIRTHVKDGAEMAKKHRLPQVLVDMILQHHGTSLIEYFYDKAVKEAATQVDVAEVEKPLFSYPGPRPQTREAGIIMLADSIEAASRTLSEPNADRIQGMVQKLINKIFASGELDECELTLKDLHLIAKCFTRVLSGIHHQRIAYAEPAEKTNPKSNEAAGDTVKESGQAEVANSGAGKQPAEGDPPEDSKASTGENLKRLGL